MKKFPLEDAYKDFIETDLAIGLGKIPLQFYEGVEVYYNLVNKHKILPKNISLNRALFRWRNSTICCSICG